MTATLVPAPALIASPPRRRQQSGRGLAANVGRPSPAAPAPGIARIAVRNAGRTQPPGTGAAGHHAPLEAQTSARYAALNTLSTAHVSVIAPNAPRPDTAKSIASTPSAGTLKTPPRKSARLSALRRTRKLPALSAAKCLSQPTHRSPVARNAAVSITPGAAHRGRKTTARRYGNTRPIGTRPNRTRKTKNNRTPPRRSRGQKGPYHDRYPVCRLRPGSSPLC